MPTVGEAGTAVAEGVGDFLALPADGVALAEGVGVADGVLVEVVSPVMQYFVRATSVVRPFCAVCAAAWEG